MQIQSYHSADDVIGSMISTLRARGCGEIRVADAQITSTTSTYLLMSGGEFAVVQVASRHKRADVDGGGVPGHYWTGTLEAEDWALGAPRSLAMLAARANLPIHRLTARSVPAPVR